MKDAYSLHLDADGLEATYQIQAAAYHRIFRRVGLGDVQMVESATGDMGGLRAHEFIAFLDVGEDVVAVCDRCGHAANIEALSASVDRCTRCDGGAHTAVAALKWETSSNSERDTRTRWAFG